MRTRKMLGSFSRKDASLLKEKPLLPPQKIQSLPRRRNLQQKQAQAVLQIARKADPEENRKLVLSRQRIGNDLIWYFSRYDFMCL